MTADIVDHPNPRKHRWVREQKLFPPDTRSNCEETHRFCEHCPIVKVTVHPPEGYPYRVWIAIGGQRLQSEHAPPCVSTVPISESPNPEKQRAGP